MFTLTRFILLLVAIIHLLIERSDSQTNARNSSINTNPIGDEEIFHLFLTFNIFLWILFTSLITLGLYQNISKTSRLKNLLKRETHLQTSYSYTISVMAVEPSLAYDYDNTSIQLELLTKKDKIISSLLMRPLWAFYSIQTKYKASKINEPRNISRRLALIGVYKLITVNKLEKFNKIRLGHNCRNPNASILIRCIEISNINTLISHTYPLNANILFLSQPTTLTYESTESDFEFNSCDEFPPKTRYEMNASNNLMERISFWLLSFNIIVLISYLWSVLYDYEYDYQANQVWLIWYNTIIISIIIGFSVAVMHSVITFCYRIFKEYNFFNQNNSVSVIKKIVFPTGNYNI